MPFFIKTNLSALARIVTLLLLIALPATATAHEVRPAIIDISIGRQNSLAINIRGNLEAILAGIGPDHANTDEAANVTTYNRLRQMPADLLKQEFGAFKQNFLKNIHLKADDQTIALKVTSLRIPPIGDPDLSRTSNLKLTGTLPAGATSLTWAWDRRFGDAVLRLENLVLAKGEKGFAGLVRAGKTSNPILLKNRKPLDRWEVFSQYIITGFEHIIPKGLDHILFVTSLFLLSTRLSSLLWQISSFTIAHTITLGLAMAGIVSVPSSVVEPLIALSIVFVAVENLFTSKMHRWRPFVVFGFGLLHGLGFASVLTEVGLQPDVFFAGLIGFNIGVELGQLTVIMACFLLVGIWFAKKPWYRSAITNPASVFIAIIASWWFIKRAFL